MIVSCSCGAINRVPSTPTARVRCGKCKHVFTPAELVKAKPEPMPAFQLGVEDDDDENEPEQCDNCGRLLDSTGCCPRCD